MSKRILRWFTDFKNTEVLSLVRDHLDLTKTAVQELYNMTCSACETSLEKKTLYNKISEVEMKADALRREMIAKLTERDVFPEERQDLMELVRAIDWVADWAREAGRILVIIPFEKAPNEMKGAAQDMAKACLRAVTLLADSMDALSRDVSKAIEIANEVEIIEEDMDVLYSIARGYLASLEFNGFSRGSLILLNEFLDALETVSDWCENTTDIIRAIAVREM